MGVGPFPSPLTAPQFYVQAPRAGRGGRGGGEAINSHAIPPPFSISLRSPHFLAKTNLFPLSLSLIFRKGEKCILTRFLKGIPIQQDL